MRYALLLSLLLLSGAAQDPPEQTALVVEWKVKWVARDVLQETREIQRRERVTLLPDRMRIDDLTFGTSWIVRADLGKVWVLNPMRGRCSELTFAEIRARQDAIARELGEAAKHVPGTQDEKDIRRILEGMGRYAKEPEVELKDTGEKKEVLGRECTGKAVVVDGEIHLVRVLTDPAFAEGAAFFGLLAKMGAFHPAVAKKLEGLGGFPVRGVIRYVFFGDRVTARVEASSIGRKKIAKGTFSVPEGLKEVLLEGFEPAPEREAKKPESLKSSFKEDDIEREERLGGLKKEDEGEEKKEEKKQEEEKP
ncbi:MAG: hypothetical protein ACYTAF_02210 [Planctomycetota bacterium]|jgi:hypothetical protein